MEASRREVLVAGAALALSSASAAHAADAPPPATWDLRELYPTHEAWAADRAALQAALPRLAGYRGKLGTDAATLKASGVAAVFTPKDYDATLIMAKVLDEIRSARGLARLLAG